MQQLNHLLSHLLCELLGLCPLLLAFLVVACDVLRMVADDVLDGGVVLVMEAAPTASVWVLFDSDPLTLLGLADRAHPIVSTEILLGRDCMEGFAVPLRSMHAHMGVVL